MKIKNEIFIRVFFIFAILVLTVILFFAFMVIPLQKSALQKTMYTQGVTVSRSIIQATSNAIISNNFGFIVEHNLEVLKNNPSIHSIYIAPIRGETIKVHQTGWRLLDNPSYELKSLESNEIAYQIKTDLQQAISYHFVYPIIFSGIKWGWLHIKFNTLEYNTYVNEMYFQLIYIAGISLFLIIFMGYFFARWVTRPISTISNLATQVANGNLEVRSTILGDGEIGRLSKSFNQMVDSLQQSKRNLENYNQQLTEEVKLRTADLASLNHNLDKRVKEEVQHRQEQERLLIQQSKLAAMGEMVGAIAHQWRQPLNALSLVMQNQYITYKAGNLNDTSMAHSLKKSERLIKKMSTTIDDFRNFSNPDKSVDQFDITVLLRTTFSLMDAQFKNQNININFNCEDNLIVTGFQGEFSQVILNLLNNAKDVLVETRVNSPCITVSAYQTAQGTQISVGDNGGGIPENIIHKIYDPYFTTKEEGKGTGIGLYMSKMIIENNMMGTLSAFNDTEGATFIIKIPPTASLAHSIIGH